MVLSKEDEKMAFEIFAFNNRQYFSGRDCAFMVWNRLSQDEKRGYVPENKEHFLAWMNERKQGK